MLGLAPIALSCAGWRYSMAKRKESLAAVRSSMQDTIDKLGEVVITQAKELTKLRAEVHVIREHYGDEIDKVLRDGGL